MKRRGEEAIARAFSRRGLLLASLIENGCIWLPALFASYLLPPHLFLQGSPWWRAAVYTVSGNIVVRVPVAPAPLPA